jgi:hypothetical protein
MSSYLSSRTSNYYKSLLQKNFTSYQVLEVFMFVFIGGLLIYGGMQLHKDHEIMLGLCKCEIEGFQGLKASSTATKLSTGSAVGGPSVDEPIEVRQKADVPSNNTLGWLLILIGVGTILLGLYRLFMKGAVAE